ncbi:MAG TPA: hypothetical protein VFG50_13265 [Rhodothermales bacterium]|nr:hypothetical protein [Rhodothermales bacterium]
MSANHSTVTLDYVETPSGRFVSMVYPDPDDITLYDIAHKLAQTNRFGGSTKHPYNVAQHAVFVSERLRRQGYPRRIQLEGLHHDDPEAFLGDIPRPWKARLGQVYKDMTLLFEEAIMVALDLPCVTDEEHKIIKAADNFALLVEARNMMPSGGHRWDYLKEMDLPSRIVTPDYFLGEQYWQESRDAYLERHRELTNG